MEKGKWRGAHKQTYISGKNIKILLPKFLVFDRIGNKK